MSAQPQVENDRRPCLVLTTWPADRPVAPLARGIVDQRLAACVHVAPAGTSTYRWGGGIEVGEEHQLVIKTTRARLAALEAHVRAAHPYGLPEWLVLDVAAGAAYLAWIGASVADVTAAGPD